MIYLLDTDVLFVLARGKGDGFAALSAKLASLDDDSRAVGSIVSYEEHMRGWMRVAAAARKDDDIIAAYQRLEMHVDFWAKLERVSYSDAAAACYPRLQHARVHVGTMDLRIAAIAISLGATVVTRNLRDFERIPDCVCEDWL